VKSVGGPTAETSGLGLLLSLDPRLPRLLRLVTTGPTTRGGIMLERLRHMIWGDDDLGGCLLDECFQAMGIGAM
jgi:hypothetical protein